MRYEPITTRMRSAIAKAMAAAHEQRRPGQDVTGRIRCTSCSAQLQFTVFPSGMSRGACLGGCGVKWTQ